jgi:23S rRNA (uracil1939-C5)-methyltransferase
LELTIEKLTYGGDGLARLPADEHGKGKVVFLPFVLPGERVEAGVVEQKPGFVRAMAEKILAPSPHRVEPGCPYFQRCGGCHYQHADYEQQLAAKAAILRENLLRLAHLELGPELKLHPSPPWNYRNRTRLQIRGEPQCAASFYKINSKQLLPVEQCPISSPLINRAIAALWAVGRRSTPPEGFREIEFFANAEDTALVAEISCSPNASVEALTAWVRDLRTEFPELIGVIATAGAERDASPPQTVRPLMSEGATEFTYNTPLGPYRVSAGSFFQINRHLIANLVEIVTHGATGNLALDLYAGVGLFSTVLARQFRHIRAVEASQRSLADLRYNLPANGKVVRATVEQYLAGQGGKLRPDFVVVDPPRSGLGERLAGSIAKLGAARIAYVSCDPATLARDLKPLTAAGYRIAQAHLMDMFPQTFHLETVLHLAR